MKVRILKEAGATEALLGLSLSYNSEPSKRVANRLAFKGGGHNKFLESVDVWLDVSAPMYWWKQADTYRISTKQSESTMHTLMRHDIVQEDFQNPIHPPTLDRLNELLLIDKDFEQLNNELPQGYLQRRIWKLPYNVIQNLVRQRRSHKLPEWDMLIDTLEDQLEYPEWVFKDVL